MQDLGHDQTIPMDFRIDTDRESRKEKRRRGASNRKVDLTDIVFDLPSNINAGQNAFGNAEQKEILEEEEEEDVGEMGGIEEIVDEEEEEEEEDLEEEDGIQEIDNAYWDSTAQLRDIPDLVPPKKVADSEQRIVEQHRRMVNERLRRRAEEKQKAIKNAKLVKTVNRRAVVQSRSVRLKYRRIPTNKKKLIYIDVVSQMIKDYLRDSATAKKCIDSIVAEESKGKGRRIRKSVMGELEKETRTTCQNIIKEYHDRVDSYFSSLIDIRLSNSLIRSDLHKINMEKNNLRYQIFDLRKERNTIGLEMKQTRDEFAKLKRKFINDEKLYKDLISLKEKSDDAGVCESVGELIDNIKFKLLKLDQSNRSIQSEEDLLHTLINLNELLQAKNV